jgi:hypothetical protein
MQSSNVINRAKESKLSNRKTKTYKSNEIPEISNENKFWGNSLDRNEKLTEKSPDMPHLLSSKLIAIQSCDDIGSPDAEES